MSTDQGIEIKKTFPEPTVRRREFPEYCPETGKRFLSVSQLNSHSKCPEAFFRERVLQEPARQAAWNVRGTAAHETIEAWENSSRDIDVTAYYADSAWPQAYQKNLEQYPDVSSWMKTPRTGTVKKDLEGQYKNGLDQVLSYQARALEEQDLWRVLESEFPFEIHDDAFIVRGFIDQVREWNDGSLSIWDLKSSGNDDRESNRQLYTYRLGYACETSEYIDVGAYFYPKLDRSSEFIDLSVYSEDYVLAQYGKLFSLLESGVFLANPSKKNCFACPVSKNCLESKFND